MAINLSVEYSNFVDEVYAQEGVTNLLETGKEKYKPLGASQIMVRKQTLSGSYDYTRMTNGGTGFGKVGAIATAWETLDLTMDRYIDFTLDVMDAEEGKIEAASLLAQWTKESQIPELDLFRFTKIVTDKGSVNVSGATLTSDTVIEAINTGMLSLDTAKVPKRGRIIYVSDEVYYKMIASGEWINSRPVQSNGQIDLSISSYNGAVVIPVNAGVFNTAATFGAGSNTLTGDSINFMILDPNAVIAVKKHSSAYIFAPGQHTMGDGFYCVARNYHGLNVLENKVNGIYINTK